MAYQITTKEVIFLDKKTVTERAKISIRFFDQILAGDRNCSKQTAIRLEVATGIPRTSWMFKPCDARKRWLKLMS